MCYCPQNDEWLTKDLQFQNIIIVNTYYVFYILRLFIILKLRFAVETEKSFRNQLNQLARAIRNQAAAGLYYEY